MVITKSKKGWSNPKLFPSKITKGGWNIYRNGYLVEKIHTKPLQINFSSKKSKTLKELKFFLSEKAEKKISNTERQTQKKNPM